MYQRIQRSLDDESEYFDVKLKTTHLLPRQMDLVPPKNINFLFCYRDSHGCLGVAATVDLVNNEFRM